MSDFFKKMKSVFVVTSEEGEPEKLSNESDSGKQNDNPSRQIRQQQFQQVNIPEKKSSVSNQISFMKYCLAQWNEIINPALTILNLKKL